jgi:hypothetical protein
VTNTDDKTHQKTEPKTLRQKVMGAFYGYLYDLGWLIGTAMADAFEHRGMEITLEEMEENARQEKEELGLPGVVKTSGKGQVN